jgi:hypothetical protein
MQAKLVMSNACTMPGKGNTSIPNVHTNLQPTQHDRKSFVLCLLHILRSVNQSVMVPLQGRPGSPIVVSRVLQGVGQGS